MKIAQKPKDEAKRLEMVRSLGLLDTLPEERFDRYTRFAKLLFNVPIAYVSFIDDEIQYYKSVVGLDIEQSPRESSFCSHTIISDGSLVVEDTIDDPRFNDHPMVVNPPYIRFYAGVGVFFEGVCVGTLCVADIRPKYPTDEELGFLKDLAHMLEQELRSESLSTTDRITGLPNRQGFLATARHAIAMSGRMKWVATLMFIRLDNLKSVIESFGRSDGEKVVREIAQLLLYEFRDSDVIARTGDDRFCVLLTGTATENTQKPLENLAAALHEENMNLPFSIEYSIGTIPFDPSSPQGIDEMIKAADVAMNKPETTTTD
ncbi:MAG TPA: diguanylate cyclase [Gammaproteobacteria bacterium]|nr:diguanylate cyclase [Gammaproteobacteria bacterium]